MKIDKYLEETLLIFILQIDYFKDLREVSFFINEELKLNKTENFRYKILLEFILYNNYPVDWAYSMFLYCLVYKGLDKYINNKNRKLILEIFKQDLNESGDYFSYKEKDILNKNYKIISVDYNLDTKYENKLNKYLEKLIEEIKFFLLATRAKSFEESYHLLPLKYKKNFINPYFRKILNNIDSKNGIYSIKEITKGIREFEEEEKISSKKSKWLSQLITDGLWSIEPDIRYTGNSYKKDQKIYLYKQNNYELDNENTFLKNKIILDYIYSLIGEKIDSKRRKIIISFMKNQFCSSPKELDRITKRFYLLEAGESPDLKSIKKVKLKKYEMDSLEKFFKVYKEDFLFSKIKVEKLLDLLKN